jgi:REP element-mobilizing transposase RayT
VDNKHGHLPRLASDFYRGHAFVHWSMTVDQRTTGWLDPAAHFRIREVMVHAAAIYGIACPVYCLMPDHAHLLWVGTRPDADQLLAARFFRRHSSTALGGSGWQRQAHDHVLREEEREQGAFQSVAHYILQNPVRAQFAATAEDYPFSGCVIPGFPSWRPTKTDFWERFWEWFNVRAV